jgi:hypothetical protein
MGRHATYMPHARTLGGAYGAPSYPIQHSGEQQHFSGINGGYDNNFGFGNNINYNSIDNEHDTPKRGHLASVIDLLNVDNVDNFDIFGI